MNTHIIRTSTKGLQVVYNNQLSATAQLSISWNNGLGGGVALSIQQAEELQGLLSEVMRLASPTIDPAKEKAAAAVEAQLLPWRDREPTP